MENQKLDFENLGIYDLRNYARNIGVLSPTKLRRDELIQKITAIIMGEQPEKKKTNKGRPPKHKINEQSKLDFILPDNMFDNNDPKYKSFQSQTKMHSNVADLLCESTSPSTTNILYDGYYKPFNANYGFVLQKGYLSKYYKENVIILNDLVQKHNLAEGDYISGASSYIQNKNIMLATSVLTINGNKEDKQRTMLNQAKIIKPNTKITLDSNGLIDFAIIDKICPFSKGARVLLNFEDKDQIKNIMTSMLNNICERNNINTFLFAIDDLPEEIYDIAYNCPEIQLVNYDFDMERQNYIEMTNLKIKHIQRLVAEGQDVAIVFYNIQNYKNNLANDAVINEGLNQQSADAYAQNKVKDLFCLARNTEHGSLTTIFIDNNDAFADICNTYIYFNAEKFSQTDITVNAIKSFTRNMQDIATEQDIKDIKQFKTGLTHDNLISKLDEIFKD